MLIPSLPFSRPLGLPVCLARFPAARLWLKDENLEDSANLPLHCHPEFPPSLDTLKVSVPPAVKLAPCQRPIPTSSPLNGANGMNDIEGKVTRVGARERGQRTSFKS